MTSRFMNVSQANTNDVQTVMKNFADIFADTRNHNKPAAEMQKKPASKTGPGGF